MAFAGFSTSTKSIECTDSSLKRTLLKYLRLRPENPGQLRKCVGPSRPFPYIGDIKSPTRVLMSKEIIRMPHQRPRVLSQWFLHAGRNSNFTASPFRAHVTVDGRMPNAGSGPIIVDPNLCRASLSASSLSTMFQCFRALHWDRQRTVSTSACP